MDPFHDKAPKAKRMSAKRARAALNAYRDARPGVDTAILALHEAGVSAADIAQEAGMSYFGVRKALIRLEVWNV